MCGRRLSFHFGNDEMVFSIQEKISIHWLKVNRTTIGYRLNNSATDVAVIQMFNPSVQSLSQILDFPTTFHNHHDHHASLLDFSLTSSLGFCRASEFCTLGNLNHAVALLMFLLTPL